MVKLYPPYIQGSVPAFSDHILSVPFSINKTVNAAEVSGIRLLIKDLYNNFLTDQIINAESYDLESGIAYFDLSLIKDELYVGQYYKIQIAYVDNYNQAGYFSSIGVTKYTSAPRVYIDKLVAGGLSGAQEEYIGTYEQIEDLTEKLYSSYFVLYDENENILYTSSEKIHNSSEDEQSNFQKEYFKLDYNLNALDFYYIQFKTVSLNGLQNSSPKYQIIKSETIKSDLTATLIAENNFEEGYVKLFFKDYEQSDINGTFMLTRIDTLKNTKLVLKYFRFELQDVGGWVYKDFTCEQGKWYQYSVQQFNDYHMYSNSILSNKVYTDFEYMYLTDGKRQLKIKYNPKVNSFKNNILESKVDTLGSQYPFFFKNAVVKYKEFPISGLLSYLSDEEQLFLTYDFLDEKYRKRTPSKNQSSTSTQFTTNLISDNYERERVWKLEVLDWLNNGDIKLFKSPAEGNYLVRIMNASLSPEDRLGRMIHTVSATAYEAAAITNENLNKYGFIDLSYPEPTLMTWSSWDLSKYEYPEGEYVVLNNSEIYGINVIGMQPGDNFDILFSGAAKYENILIGNTGAYLLDNVKIASIRLKNKPHGQPIISYKHYVNDVKFDYVNNIIYRGAFAFSVLGTELNDIYFLKYNLKYNVNRINYLHFEKMEIIEVPNINNIDANKIYIYKIDDKYYNHKRIELKEFSLDNCYNIQYNNSVIGLADKIEYNIDIKENTDIDLKIGYGIKLDLAFSIKEIEYIIEDTNEEVKHFKEIMLYNIKNNPQDFLRVQSSYNDFINALDKALEEEVHNNDTRTSIR